MFSGVCERTRSAMSDGRSYGGGLQTSHHHRPSFSHRQTGRRQRPSQGTGAATFAKVNDACLISSGKVLIELISV